MCCCLVCILCALCVFCVYLSALRVCCERFVNVLCVLCKPGVSFCVFCAFISSIIPVCSVTIERERCLCQDKMKLKKMRMKNANPLKKTPCLNELSTEYVSDIYFLHCRCSNKKNNTSTFL